MRRFRIGNDITIVWSVMKSGKAAELDGKSIRLYMTHAKGREEVIGHSVSGNTVRFTISGLSQSVLGNYTLTIDIRYPGDAGRYLIQDKCGAFELVGRSCVEEPEETDYIVNL